jgi:hypothetical protein
MVRGVVAAPRDAVWRALLSITPELAGQDVSQLSTGAKVYRFVAPLGEAAAGTVKVEVNPALRSIARQGQWWYRGVTSVDAATEGSEVGMRVFNVAPLITRWLVPFVHHHDAIGFRTQHQRLVEALGNHLECAGHLLPE